MSKILTGNLISAALFLFTNSCADLPEPRVDGGYPVEASEAALPVVAVQREQLERITTAVPWPRGVRYIDGKLYALARGVHRSGEGPQADIEDLAGTIFVIDPSISEPVADGQPVGEAVRNNAKVLAAPTSPPFRIWNRQMPATKDLYTDRPYCMLVYDRASRNFFVCGYSGIDLPGKEKFRKNATDSIHRYDLRIGKWKIVEAHNPDVVPVAALGYHVDSTYYPHHDPKKNPPPHGLINGPCGATVAGKYIYVGAKDNTALAQYDLAEIRRNPEAPPPPARFIFDGTSGNAQVNVKGHGKMTVNGTCAVEAHGGFLYVAFRTTSQILRFPLREDGGLVEPLEAEYIAQFATYNPAKKGGSADIYDMTFDSEGNCYVSPGYDGAIYRFKPDPKRLYDSKKGYEPYVDLQALAGAKKSGNICFDDDGNLYICSGQKVIAESKIRGVIYRVRPRD